MRLGLHPHSSGPVSNSVYNNIFHYTDVEHACVLFSLFLFKYKSIFQKIFSTRRSYVLTTMRYSSLPPRRVGLQREQKETPLPQTDRATRYVSQMKLLSTVETSCTTNPQQIAVMEGYS